MTDTKPAMAHSFPPPPYPHAPVAKRPRLSPGLPPSPYTHSPAERVTFAIPETHSPFANSFNEPLPTARPAASQMATPAASGGQKADKATDITELGDIISAVGINLKDEEAAFFASTYKAHPSTTPHFAEIVKQRNNMPFDVWTRSAAVSQLAEIGVKSGVLSSNVTPAEYENDLKHFAASVNDASEKSKHLTNPFLQANVVRQVLDKRQRDAAIRLRDHTEITATPTSYTGHMARLPDGSAVVSARSVTIPQKSDLASLLSLISLAAQERVRSLLEDAYTTSRARVYGAKGAVPPEWKDLAVSKVPSEEITVVPTSISGTAWDALPENSVNSTTTNPAKRKAEDDEPSPASQEPESESTIRFPPVIPKMLIQFGDGDFEAERKRIEARKKRKLDKDAKEKSGEATTTTAVEAGATSGGATPASSSMPPPATTPAGEATGGTPAGGTKRKKGDKTGKQAHFSDIQQHRAATSTAQLFTGNMAKRFSWMTSATSSGASTPARGGLATGAGMADRLAAQKDAKKDANAPAALETPQEEPGLVSKKAYRKLGLLEEAPSITLKDVLGVLERSGKEKRALVRGYARLDKDR